MDLDNFDVDFLAKETLALTEALREQREKNLEQKELFEFVEKEEVIEPQAPIEFQNPISEKINEQQKIVEQECIEEELVEQLPVEEEIVELECIEEELIESELVEQEFAEEAFEPEEELEAIAYPPVPGVFYKVERSGATFSIRGFCTENLRDEFNRLESNEDPTLWEELRVSDEEREEGVDLKFYPTEQIEYAGMIVDTVLNRRFPIDEDALCNLSDPGFSWWLEEVSNGFSIHFRSYGLDMAEHFVRLGPLSDTSIAQKRLLQAEDLLRSYFPISEFSCDPKSFHIRSVKEDHLSFEFLKNIFLHGENFSTEDQFPQSNEGKTLFFYFKELAAVRGFWMGIQESIDA